MDCTSDSPLQASLPTPLATSNTTSAAMPPDQAFTKVPMQLILSYATVTVVDLRARGVAENIIQFVEMNRLALQRAALDQSNIQRNSHSNQHPEEEGHEALDLRGPDTPSYQAGISNSNGLPLEPSGRNSLDERFSRQPQSIQLPPPLERARFEHSYKAFCQDQNIHHDLELMSVEGRPIDLHLLHVYVMREGGFMNVSDKGMWDVIGGRLDFVQFPGNDTELPRSGPRTAQHLAQVYAKYVSEFDEVYIQAVLDLNGRQQRPGPNHQRLAAANSFIRRIKDDFNQNRIAGMPDVQVMPEQRMEYNTVLEGLHNAVVSLEPKLPIFFIVLKDQEMIKKSLVIICAIHHQRTLLSSGNPRFVVSLDMLRMMQQQLHHMNERFNYAVSASMGRQDPNRQLKTFSPEFNDSGRPLFENQLPGQVPEALMLQQRRSMTVAELTERARQLSTVVDEEEKQALQLQKKRAGMAEATFMSQMTELCKSITQRQDLLIKMTGILPTLQMDHMNAQNISDDSEASNPDAPLLDNPDSGARPPLRASGIKVQMQLVLSYADVTVDDLRARGVAEKIVQFVDMNRLALQRTAMEQRNLELRRNLRTNQQHGPLGSSFDDQDDSPRRP